METTTSNKKIKMSSKQTVLRSSYDLCDLWVKYQLEPTIDNARYVQGEWQGWWIEIRNISGGNLRYTPEEVVLPFIYPGRPLQLFPIELVMPYLTSYQKSIALNALVPVLKAHGSTTKIRPISEIVPVEYFIDPPPEITTFSTITWRIDFNKKMKKRVYDMLLREE